MVLRERLYNGNVERFAEQFLSRNSLFVWVLRTQSAKKRRYEAMMSDPGYAHLTFVRLRSRGETEAWLAGLEVDQARLHTRAPHTGTAQPHPGRIVQANCEGRSSPAPDEGLG